MSPVLRAATDADLPVMAEIFLAAWRSGYRGVVPDAVIVALTPASVGADLAARIDDPDLHTVLALAATGRPVGFTRFGPDAEHAGGGYLAALYVHLAAAGAGIGGALLRHALTALAGLDVRLWVFEGNDRAHGLYERAGFGPDGARRTDPRWQTPQVRLLRRAGD